MFLRDSPSSGRANFKTSLHCPALAEAEEEARKQAEREAFKAQVAEEMKLENHARDRDSN